ncbi:MAG: 3-oxo-tetronate kinase, partial [Pseudomonadota bacterium]|nr:3-oxo-tetronate kinase [Pseudomonadota bacterium]
MSILLGAIADDFTGATDLANTLVKGGMRTIQLIGVPKGDVELPKTDAVVVALKSRTIPVKEAVSASLEAMQWLLGRSAHQIYFNYCSTFESTDDGNIGPVADALCDTLVTDFAIACPAFPATGRTIYKGHLFVGDVLLSQSSMRDHPLTPMRDSDLVAVLGRQTTHKVGLVPYETVRQGAKAVGTRFDALKAEGVRYAVVDILADEDLMTLGEACAGHALITGGSGAALGLPANFRKAGLLGKAKAPALPRITGKQAVLAGSCSAATLRQVAHVS